MTSAFSFTEIIGYIGSFALILSFIMKDIKKLRIITSIGCALFVWYGYMHDALPIMITNSAIVAINIYFLARPNKIV